MKKYLTQYRKQIGIFLLGIIYLFTSFSPWMDSLSVNADTSSSTDLKNINYNITRILTNNGLTDITKYKQVLDGATFIGLPSDMPLVNNEIIAALGMEQTGLTKYLGRVEDEIVLRADIKLKELKNIIFNLPPYRTEESVHMGTGTSSMLRDTRDYIKMYLEEGALDHASEEERKVVTKLAKVNVDVPELKITASGFDSQNPVKVKGSYAYYGPISFEANRKVIEGTAAVKSVSVGADATVVNTDFTELDRGKIKLSDEYYLKVNNTDKIYNVTIHFSVQSPIERLAFYTNRLDETPGGFCIVPYVELVEETAGVDVGSFGKLGSIRVKCTDMDTGEVIPNASFLVESTEEGNDYPITTNSKGFATTPIIPIGTYKITQKDVPFGYQRSTVNKFATIQFDGTTVDIAYTNRKFSAPVKVVITTDDATNKALNGGSVAFYNQEGQMVASGIVDVNGSFSVVLQAGVYTVKQITAKSGYLPDSRTHTVEINSNEMSPTFYFRNARVKGSISIGFYDPMEQNKALESGSFLICNEEGKTVKGPFTMNGGSFLVSDLETGTYIAKQTVPPTGYRLNENSFYFTILSSSEVKTVSIPNTKKEGVISLTAIDEEGRFLENVLFEIRNERGEKIGAGKTDANGYLAFSGLPYGTYTCQAVAVPEGYVLNTSKTTKIIRKDGQTEEGRHIYEMLRGTVRIQKIDSVTLQGVAGAVLSIKNRFGVEVARITTDETGIVSVPLLYGSYTVQEVDPGNGYAVTGQKESFSIMVHGETVDVMLNATKIVSDVIITVRKSLSPYQLIPGAVFTLYSEAGAVINGYRTITTNEFGQATLQKLPYGKYYIKQTATIPECTIYQQELPFTISVNGEVIPIEVQNVVKTGSITLLYRDKDTKAPIYGAYFTLYNGDDDSELATAMSNQSGLVFFTKVPYGKYYIKMTKAAPGYKLDPTIIGGNETTKEITKEARMSPLSLKAPRFIIIDDDTPNVNIGGDVAATVTVVLTTEDATHKPLNGGTIAFYDKDGNVATSGTVDEAGNFVVVLQAGVYTIRQLSAKSGYLIDNRTYTVDINSNEMTPTFYFRNARIKGSIRVAFYDPAEQNKALESGSFVICDEEGNTVKDPFAMNGTSYLVNDLDSGSYTIKQTIAPAGYLKNENTFQFTVLSSSDVKTVSIPNTKKEGVISLTAVDEEGKFLENVRFEIRNEGGEKVSGGRTNENGFLAFSSLAVGTYTCQAVEVPEGYVLNSSKTVKVIENDGQTEEGRHVYEQLRGTVRVQKIDSSTLQGMTGAVLSIKTADGMEVARVITEQNGIIAVRLPYGSYTVQEVEPQNGYVLTGQKEAFSIRVHGETVDVVLSASKISGNVTIRVRKSLSPYKTIPDAVFTLYNKDGSIVNGYRTITTNEFGEAKINKLPFGTYYLKQTATVPECMIHEADIPFTIAVNGEVIPIQVENVVKTGSITLLYRDKDTKEPIYGAYFTLYNGEDDSEIATVMTNESGLAIFTRVPYGKYYIKMTKAAPGYKLDPTIIGGREESNKENNKAVRTAFVVKTPRFINIDDENPDVTIGDGAPTVSPNNEGNSGSTGSGNGTGTGGSTGTGSGTGSGGHIIIEGEKEPNPSPTQKPPTPTIIPTPTMLPLPTLIPNPTTPPIPTKPPTLTPPLPSKAPTPTPITTVPSDQIQDVYISDQKNETEEGQGEDVIISEDLSSNEKETDVTISEEQSKEENKEESVTEGSPEQENPENKITPIPKPSKKPNQEEGSGSGNKEDNGRVELPKTGDHEFELGLLIVIAGVLMAIGISFFPRRKKKK